jgi:hypothetical protein
MMSLVTTIGPDKEYQNQIVKVLVPEVWVEIGGVTINIMLDDEGKVEVAAYPVVEGDFPPLKHFVITPANIMQAVKDLKRRDK